MITVALLVCFVSSFGQQGTIGDMQKKIEQRDTYLLRSQNQKLGASAIQFINSNRNLKRANRLSLQINKPIAINMGLYKRALPYSVGIGIPIN